MIKPRSLLVAAAILTAAPVALNAQFEAWHTGNGRVVLHFDDTVLEQAGLQLLEVTTTAAAGDQMAELMEEPMIAFVTDPASSDLVFLSGHNGAFLPYSVLGGGVHALGGFILSSPSTGRMVDFTDFVIHAEPVRNDGPGGEPDPDYFFLSTPDELIGDFKLCYVKIAFDIEGNPYGATSGADHNGPIVRIKAWDLIVTEQLAGKLDRPDLMGLVLGDGKVETPAEPYDGEWSYPPGQNPWTPYAGEDSQTEAGPGDGTVIDVKLGILSSLTQLGHLGTYPDGRAGLSSSTTSCNVGSQNVKWLAPMNEDHPGIHQALYRQLGNRFEQVGVAWIKHGFFALSNSQCTPCQNPSPGTFLGIGCSDTYGTSNNGNRMYLGPRDEWDAHLSTWKCLGSYFDGTPADCIRSESGAGNGAVDHRLEAFDADLGNPGATYYYEGMYLVHDDVDKHNNVASREVTMSWNGFSWQFTTPSAVSGNPTLEGPAIERYGELRTLAGLEPADGNVILAVQTADLGGGQWRYEYALFNWDLDRRVNSFSVPACGNPRDFYFHDIDDQTANDWAPVVEEGMLTFTFPEVFLPGHKVAGPLEWGYLYNFGFTSSVAPSTRNAVLGVYDAGPGGDLLGASTLAPGCLNLASSKMSPEVGEMFTISVTGGSDAAMIAITETGGVPLPTPLVIGPIPFASGEMLLPVSVPPVAAGLTFKMIAGEVTTAPLALVGLTNSMTIAVQ